MEAPLIIYKMLSIMKNKTKNLILIFCLSVFFACDSYRVEVESPYPEKTLAINAFLIPNNAIYTFYPGQVVADVVQLHSLNEGYSKDTIKDAMVTMTAGNGQVFTLAYDTVYNDYRADVSPDSNQTYALKVVCDSFPPLYAEDVMPAKVELDSVQIDPFVRVNSLGAAIGQATIYFKDLPEIENYYEIQITNGVNSKNGKYIYSDDPIITSEFYYPENIELQAYEPNRLLFTDQSFGEKQQAITFSFYTGSSSGSSGNKISAGYITIKFRAVSKNYYTYFTSYLDYMFNMSGDGLLGTTEPINIFGNVENGYGIFGAYQEVYSEKYFEEIRY